MNCRLTGCSEIEADFMINNCSIDLERTSILLECMGMRNGRDSCTIDREFTWNVISKKAVAYSCGMIAREGEQLIHNHYSSEIELCKKLSKEASDIMTGKVMIDDEGDHAFSPFFIAANKDSPIPEAITEELVRSAFNDTIYPAVEILVEPLTEDTEWWDTVRECAYGLYEEEADYISCWRSVISWFNGQPKLQSSAFVTIGQEAIGDAYSGGGSGCVFPRLVVGLSERGSLIGIFTCVTHT